MKDVWSSYHECSPELAPFFQAFHLDIFTRPLEANALNEALVQEINAYQQQIGSSAKVAASDIIVATGQQPGLFTGPLYTIYKALTAVKLAQRISEKSSKPACAIFWLASTDHDIEESGTAHFLTRRYELLTLHYPRKTEMQGWPMCRLPITSEMHNLVSQAAEAVLGGPDKESIADFLHETLDASRSLSEWTSRLLARLFRGLPIVFFEPTLPEARKVAVKVFRKELDNPTETTRRVNMAGACLQEIGFPAQIRKSDHDCSFFIVLGNMRRKVVFENGVFTLPEIDKTIDREQMQKWLEDSPEVFSENVALRPVIQQALLNPVAYVAGPGELAYWAQLRHVFEFHGFDMPIVFPRARLLLLTTKHKKLLQKYGLSAEDLSSPMDHLVDLALRRTAGDTLLERFSQEKRILRDALGRFCEKIGVASPELNDMARALRERAEQALNRMETALLRKDKARVDVVEQHLYRLVVALAPFQKPQERVYNIFSFMVDHGWEIISRLFREISLTSADSREVEL